MWDCTGIASDVTKRHNLTTDFLIVQLLHSFCFLCSSVPRASGAVVLCKYFRWDWALEKGFTASLELSSPEGCAASQWALKIHLSPLTQHWNNKHKHHAQLFDRNLRAGSGASNQHPCASKANSLLTELSHWPCSWIFEPVLTAANLQVRGHLCFYLFNIKFHCHMPLPLMLYWICVLICVSH